MGIWRESIVSNINSKSRHLETAIKTLKEEYGLHLGIADKKLLLDEIEKGIEINRKILKNYDEGGTGAGLIRPDTEAMMNYLGKYHGLNSPKEQDRILHGTPTKSMRKKAQLMQPV